MMRNKHAPAARDPTNCYSGITQRIAFVRLRGAHQIFQIPHFRSRIPHGQNAKVSEANQPTIHGNGLDIPRPEKLLSDQLSIGR